MRKRVMSFLLVIMMLFTMLPVTTFAEQTEMSHEFAEYLNAEGKLEVTFTASVADEEFLVREYVNGTGNFDVFGEYYFNMDLNTYNEATNTCTLSRINLADGTPLESHEVEVVFEESISETFASFLTNGKIILPTTSKNISVDRVNSYISNLSNDEYNFEILQYCDDVMAANYRPLINEDFTEATIKMSKNNSSEAEVHIIQLDRITKQSDAFKKYLNEEGQFEVNSIVPTNHDYFGTMYQALYTKQMEDGVYVDYLSDDYMSGDLLVGNEVHTVDIKYIYDTDVQKKLQPLVDNFPEDIEYFVVEDMELINYWKNTVNSDDINNLAGYSGELKAYLNNYNVQLSVDEGCGSDEAFVTDRIGMAAITYDGSAYYVNGWLGAHAEHVIYVPDNTGDTKEALIAAAQKRIDEYLGAGNGVKVSYAGNAKTAYIDASYELSRPIWEPYEPNLTKDEWAMGWMPAYQDFGAEVMGIEGVKEDDDTFLITVTEGNVSKTYNIVIKKDSSKMITPTYATADIKNNIEISSTSSEIPLDTTINSEKLTSGTEYNKVIKLIDVDVNETYDINLYSNSLQKNITKLESGKFEVKIPVSEELAKKNLVAYYVDENDKVVKYKVDVDKEGNAVFETDHFSIYTIAEGSISNESVDVEIVSPKDNAADSKLGEDAATIIEKVPFTEEEKSLIAAGADVVITLEVKDISDTVSVEDKEKVENKIKETKDQKVGMYLDINLLKQVGDNSAVKVSDLNGKIKLQLTVPDELLIKDTSKNREYGIIRIHNEEVDMLETEFDPETKFLTFETDHFSTYALVYKDVAKAPVTGDDASIMNWLMLFVVGCGVVAYGLKSRKTI